MEDESSRLNRRDALKMTGVSAVAMGMAGCSSLLGEDDGGGSGGDAEVPDEPIEIGAQTFLEGGAYLLGQDNEMGFELAVQHINEAGGIAGREINLDMADEGEGAIENYERFVDQGKDVTFGVLSSGNSVSLAPVVEDNEVINICQDGATFSLFEETLTDPEYFFRLSPPDAGEAIVMARDAINELGAENINTVASVNQNYAWGQSQHAVFSQAIQKLTDAEIAYEGFPEFGAEDYSTHIEQVNSVEPDVLMTSKWGADLLLFMRQAAANNMFENVDVIVGSIGTSILSEIGREEMEQWSEFILGGRILGSLHDPDQSTFPPNAEIEQAIIDEYGEDRLPVSGFFASAYASMYWYATAAEKAVRILGRWPEDEELTNFMSSHGFWTPFGFHTSENRLQNGRQNYSNLYSGKAEWDEEMGRPTLTDINRYPAQYVTPPPGRQVEEWIDSW